MNYQGIFARDLVSVIRRCSSAIVGAARCRSAWTHTLSMSALTMDNLADYATG